MKEIIYGYMIYKTKYFNLLSREKVEVNKENVLYGYMVICSRYIAWLYVLGIYCREAE